MMTASTRQVVFWLAIFAFLFLSLYLLSGILLPFVVGMAIAYVLDPVVRRLVAWRIPHSLAVAGALLMFLLALVAVLTLLVPLIEVQATQLAAQAPKVVGQARQQLQQLMDLVEQKLSPEQAEKVQEAIGGWTTAALSWAVRIAESLLTSSLALANILSLIVITPIVAFFLLRDWHRIIATIDAYLPRHQAATIREQAHLVDETLAGFLRGQLLVSFALGVYYAVALTIAGLQFALIIGLLIGILSFIPIVGAAIGFLVAVILAMLQFKSWTGIAIIVGIFALGQTVEGNVLSPKLVGARVHLHPVWVIFALLAFGALFGFIGVLVALPMAAVIGVLVRFALSRYLTSPLYDPIRYKRERRE